MADDSLIEWTDATWNPITGCSVVSAGCKHCYAMKLAGTRMKNEPSRAGLTIDTAAGPVWNGQVRFNAQWLEQPLRWKRPRRIFVCAHGDLFHESVPDAWIDRVFAVMALAPQHTFQVLTKRPERMHSYLHDSRYRTALIGIDAASISGLDRDLPDDSPRWSLPLPNVWLGVSVENQDAADARIQLLVATPAAVRWISAEPLLGPVDLSQWLWNFRSCANCPCPDPEKDLTGLDACCRDPEIADASLQWVVVGGESGTNSRPMHPEWARSLRDQCADAGVQFLFKQWGEYGPCELHPPSDPAPYSCVTFSGTHLQGEHAVSGGNGPGDNPVEIIARFGKKRAGRLLDGVLHDGYPTP